MESPANRNLYNRTRKVTIRLTEEEYEGLQSLARGYKSISYFLRSMIKARISYAISKHSYIPTRPRRVRKQFGRKVGRNEPCPCGSGRKFKRCCINKDVLVHS